MDGAFRNELAAERPRTPDTGYGVPAEGGTMIAWSDCIDRLHSAEAYWLATVGPGDQPHVVPIWGVLVEDDLYLETGDPNTAKVRHLATNPAATVHLDGINDALILQGRALPFRPGPALGVALAAAFRAKYPEYAPEPDSWDDVGMHRLEPRVMLAWREMPTATRWRFPTDSGTENPT